MYDVEEIRGDFPILERRFNGKRLVYLDNAATSQKPQPVIQALTEYSEQHNANIHRGVHRGGGDGGLRGGAEEGRPLSGCAG